MFLGDGQPLYHRYSKFPTTAFFEYHCWESESSSDAELWHHTHQKCTVVRRLTPKESDFEGYVVRFVDGFESHATADELMNSPKKYERPDYRREE